MHTITAPSESIARAHPWSVFSDVLPYPLWRRTRAPAARQRRRMIYNEDPRSHLKTQRANAAPALRCMQRLPSSRAAEMRCLALPQSCMIEDSWLWRMLSCRMQDIRPLCIDNVASRTRALRQRCPATPLSRLSCLPV